jgi:hypothetical protein
MAGIEKGGGGCHPPTQKVMGQSDSILDSRLFFLKNR